MSIEALSLASEFPAATREGWSALVDKVLKGADFERKLVSRTPDGIRIEPLYPRAADPAPLLRGPARPWRVAGRLDHPDAAEANALALADLEGGADALVLSLAGAPAARGFGLANGTDPATLERALGGVMLDLIALSVETAPFAGQEAAEAVAALAARRGHEAGTLDVDFGLDPAGDLARTGRRPLPWPDLAEKFARTAGTIREAGFGGACARIDTRAYHEAGASEAQELAAALATGVAYLRALEAGGFPLEAARGALSFLLVADADEFLTIAKFRALRRLWASVEEACGLAPEPIRLRAETAWRMATRRDPYVNVLRGTIAGFSAGIGGADEVAILPFTAALGLPDAFARRIARNTQLILLEESNLWRVADPVAGAGGFEALTDALVEQAWTLFQEIEREGGIVATLGSGALARRIAEVRTKRLASVATRRDALTGTSEFPDLREAGVAVLLPAGLTRQSDAAEIGVGGRAADPSPAGEGRVEAELRAGVGIAPAVAPPHPGRLAPTRPPLQGRDQASHLDTGRHDEGEAPAPLPSIRLAEPFEALRQRSDAILAETGRRPQVFLATLGRLADFAARAGFAKNAFEAVGIEAVGGAVYGSIEELAEAVRASGSGLACLCGSDEVYAGQAEPAARALKAAGAGTLLLAGRPGEREAADRAAGIDRFLFAGADLPGLLGDLVR